jgi:hypothetical protein
MPTKKPTTTNFEVPNIFYLDHNPTVAAEALPDFVLRQLIEPSFSLLASAYLVEKAAVRYPAGIPEKFQDHPCALWAREDFKHWNWLMMHTHAMCKEWKLRFGEDHPFLEAVNYMNRKLPLSWLRHKDFWDPPITLPAEYVVRIRGARGCYREYVRANKEYHKWTNRGAPLWLLPWNRREELINELIDGAAVGIDNIEQYKPEVVNAKDWKAIKLAALDVVNGVEPQFDDDRVDDLIDAARLVIVKPEQHRPKDLTEAEWSVLKVLAEDRLNGIEHQDLS